MKNVTFYLLVALLMPLTSFAYNQGVGDPQNGSYGREYKIVRKSTTDGYSLAITKGMVLSYDLDNIADGYTVTAVNNNNALGANKIACVAEKAIATGDTGQFRCITKGFVDFLLFDASSNAISVGEKLCASDGGVAVQCAGCDEDNGDNDCDFGNATQNTGIVSHGARANGSAATLKAYINLK